MKANDYAMMRSPRPMQWVQDWMQRTKKPAVDTLTALQAHEVDLLLQARSLSLCRSCGVTLEVQIIDGANGGHRSRIRRQCSWCASR